MRYSMFAIICAVSVLLTVIILPQPTAGTSPLWPHERRDVQALAVANNRFAVDFYRQVSAGDGNVFCSPSSIHTALSMVLAGAKGQTAEQMGAVLHVADSEDIGDAHRANRYLLAAHARDKHHPYELTVANALWGQKGYPWKKGYLATTRDDYRAGLREVDFRTAAEDARKTINEWVAAQTNRKITNLMPRGSVNTDTRLVLTNAVYFKGTWRSQFNKRMTRDMPFTSGSKKVQAKMMYQKARFGYAADDDVQVLLMPYKGEALSMGVVLPKKADGLGAVEKKLTEKKLAAWIAGAKHREVRVFLPRFKMTQRLDLKGTLQTLGMTEVFVPGKANLSGMNGKRDLYVQAAVHKAFVDVNEEGTEAAAATGMSVGVTSVPMDPPPIFKADHPFLFLIRHNKTGAILFIGRLSDPTQ